MKNAKLTALFSFTLAFIGMNMVAEILEQRQQDSCDTSTCYIGERCEYPGVGFTCDALEVSNVTCSKYWDCIPKQHQ